MSLRRSSTFHVVACLAFGLTARASAETTQCTVITTVPTTIDTPGIYCLTSDLYLQSDVGVAVTINSNDVVLDLNGHALDNLAAGPATGAIGIGGFRRKDVVIKNGVIRGFTRAIQAADSSPYQKSQRWVIEDLRISGSTWNAVQVAGRDCVVRRTIITAIGGTTIYGVNVDSHAIVVLGPGHRVIDNDVIKVTGQGTGTGQGIAFGILTDGGMALGNRVTDASHGLVFLVGSVKYRGNLTTGVTTAYSGGTDVGDNN
jgi:hypothetical protein